jgi:hypothetical protein
VKQVFKFFLHEYPAAIAAAAAAGKFPKDFKTYRKHQERRLAKVRLDYTYVDKETNERRHEHDAVTLPRELLLDRDRLLHVCVYSRLEDLYKFWQTLHPSHCQLDLSEVEVVASSDGVRESQHGRHKFHILSVCFQGCSSPLPWFVWQHRYGDSPSLEDILDPMVDDLKRAGCRLKLIVSDGLEQNALRGLISTGGFYGCGWCTTKGVTADARRVHYPWEECHFAPRNMEDWRNLFEGDGEDYFDGDAALEASVDIRQGVNRYTPLLQIPNFNLVTQVPLDSLHLIHIGITKAMWNRIYGQGAEVLPVRSKKDCLQAANRLVSRTKVPSEIKRRTREVQPANMKASEWQVVDTYCLVSIALTLRTHKQLQRCLLVYTFLIRAYNVDEDTFTRIQARCKLDRIHKQFYMDYQEVFGPQAVTFNAHSFYHLQVDRELNGPLWAHSTARFESMYGKARSCYDAKTANTPKQLFFWLMCRMRNQHACGTRRAVVINPKVTLKRDDSLIFDGSHFYKVKAKQGAVLKCVRIRTAIITTKTIFQLPWSLVGVKLVSGYQSATEIVPLANVKAKAVAALLPKDQMRDRLVTKFNRGTKCRYCQTGSCLALCINHRKLKSKFQNVSTFIYPSLSTLLYISQMQFLAFYHKCRQSATCAFPSRLMNIP